MASKKKSNPSVDDWAITFISDAEGYLCNHEAEGITIKVHDAVDIPTATAAALA